MNLKSLLKSLIVEDLSDCVDCQGQKPRLLNEQKVYNNIAPIFKGTKLNNKKFLNESSKLLANGNDCGFLVRLYEEIEDTDSLLDICLLTFSKENIKLGQSVMTFSLPAGWTCPFAKGCLTKVSRDRVIDPEKVGTYKISKKTGEKIPYKGDVEVKVGKDAVHRCYAAMQEMQYDAVRENRWHNFDLLLSAGKDGGIEAQADLITRSINYFMDSEGQYEKLRIHESGDFYNNEYFNAWMLVAQRIPEINFYAYSKSLPYVKWAEEQLKNIPNFAITLSEGGRDDDKLDTIDIKRSTVFNKPEDALKANKLIDLDDTLAMQPGGREKSFGLLLHGTQEAGEKSRDKRRNETFMAYWKYLKKLNRQLYYLKLFPELNERHRITTEEALYALKSIESIKSKKIKNVAKTELDFISKLLRYVIKYNNYNFSKTLEKIIPNKFK
jgi:hypothetical protein